MACRILFLRTFLDVYFGSFNTLKQVAAVGNDDVDDEED
jgi:hypothetical protein